MSEVLDLLRNLPADAPADIRNSAEYFIQWAEAHPETLAFIDSLQVPTELAADPTALASYVQSVAQYVPDEWSNRDTAVHQDNLAVYDYYRQHFLQQDIKSNKQLNAQLTGTREGDGEDDGDHDELSENDGRSNDSAPGDDRQHQYSLQLCACGGPSPTPTPPFTLQDCSEYPFPAGTPTLYRWLPGGTSSGLVWDRTTGKPLALPTSYQVSDTGYGTWYSTQPAIGVAPQWVHKVLQETSQQCSIVAFADAEPVVNRSTVFDADVVDRYHTLRDKYWYPFGQQALAARYSLGVSPHDLVDWMHQEQYPQANYTINNDAGALASLLAQDACPIVVTDDSPCAVYPGAHWMVVYGHSAVDVFPPNWVKSRFPQASPVSENKWVCSDSFDPPAGTKHFPVCNIDEEVFDKAWSMNTTRNQLCTVAAISYGAAIVGAAVWATNPFTWWLAPATAVSSIGFASQVLFNAGQLGRTIVLLKPATPQRQVLSIPKTISATLPTSNLFVINSGASIRFSSDYVSPTTFTPDGAPDKRVRLNLCLPSGSKISKVLLSSGQFGWSTNGGTEGAPIRMSYSTSSFTTAPLNFVAMPFSPNAANGYLDLIESDLANIISTGNTLHVNIYLTNGRITSYDLKL